MDPRPRGEVVAFERRLGDHQQGSRGIAGLAGYRSGDRRKLSEHRLQFGHFGQAGLARCFVVPYPFAGHDFVDETARGHGLQRPAMALQGIGFHVLAADVPVVGDTLSGVELVDRLFAKARLPALAAGERVGKAQWLPGQHRRGNRDLGHGLHTTHGNHILGATHHRLRGEVQRLL